MGFKTFGNSITIFGYYSSFVNQTKLTFVANHYKYSKNNIWKRLLLVYRSGI